MAYTSITVEGGLFTADLLDSDPDLVKRFLKATMRGFAFALENEEETLDIVLEFAPQEDREHQRFMLRQEISDARGPVTDANGLGFMTDEQWQVFYDTLLKHEALARPFDPRSAYTTRFLQDIYDGGELQWP